MFLFHLTHFLKFLVKSQPQRSNKKGSYIKKSVLQMYNASRGIVHLQIILLRFVLRRAKDALYVWTN